jgi:ubiquinone/menaquinone biosynthesis C-methylase UbiE
MQADIAVRSAIGRAWGAWLALAVALGCGGSEPPLVEAGSPATTAPASGTQAASSSRAEAVAPPAGGVGANPAINARFRDPDLDAARWTRTFEGESREIARHKEAIVRALDLGPGDRVADIGAGTGLFLPLMSRAVGPQGMVYAVDISPTFLEHLRRRAAQDKLHNAVVVAGTDRSVELAPGSVDLAFVCDTYHHFEHPAESLASIWRALRPGGRLVVIDFHREPGKSAAWILDHVRANKEVFRAEIEQAGFRFLRELTVPGVKENYLLVFERPDPS